MLSGNTVQARGHRVTKESGERRKREKEIEWMEKVRSFYPMVTSLGPLTVAIPLETCNPRKHYRVEDWDACHRLLWLSRRIVCIRSSRNVCPRKALIYNTSNAGFGTRTVTGVRSSCSVVFYVKDKNVCSVSLARSLTAEESVCLCVFVCACVF